MTQKMNAFLEKEKKILIVLLLYVIQLLLINLKYKADTAPVYLQTRSDVQILNI